MKRNLLFLFLIASLLVGACASSAASPSIADSRAVGFGGGAPQDAVQAPGAPEQMALPAAMPAATAAPMNSAANPSQPRIVIQNADLSIVVKDPQAKMLAIGAMAQRLGGFVVSSNMYETYTGDNIKVPEGSITIRIPASDLDSALNEIKADAVDVQTENRSGQDVTDQYVDL